MTVKSRMAFKSSDRILVGQYNYVWQGLKIDVNRKLITKSFIDDVFFRLVSSCRFEIKDELNLKEFISNNLGIEEFLFEAPNIVKKYFPSSNLRLSVLSDAENDSRDKELFIFIKTKLKPEVSYRKLNEIQKDWLFKIEDPKASYINISLEYI